MIIKYNTKDFTLGYYNSKKINKAYKKGEIYQRIEKNELVFQGKWIATFADGHTESAECNTISAITRGEITLTDLVAIDFGDCVSSLGNSLFEDCTSLKNVSIGTSISAIGDDAFARCTGLSSVILKATTPPTLSNGAFDNTTCDIYVPCDSLEIYRSTSGWSDYSSRIKCIEHNVYIESLNGFTEITDTVGNLTGFSYTTTATGVVTAATEIKVYGVTEIDIYGTRYEPNAYVYLSSSVNNYATEKMMVTASWYHLDNLNPEILYIIRVRYYSNRPNKGTSAGLTVYYKLA